MAGFSEDESMSPGGRDRIAREQKVFPWGNNWPDTEKVGNFADMSAARETGISSARIIPGYDDGFPFTAPVGSFPPKNGIHDLSGNVQEWVEDDYSRVETNGFGVLRGGGWSTYQYDNLYTGFRNAVPPKSQDPSYGFRVVLAKPPAKAE
jgi:formylglycine-generating enzyme required for sulfatase activity